MCVCIHVCVCTCVRVCVCVRVCACLYFHVGLGTYDPAVSVPLPVSYSVWGLHLLRSKFRGEPWGE